MNNNVNVNVFVDVPVRAMAALVSLMLVLIVTSAVAADKTQFAFGVNAADWSLTQYRVDPATGLLQHNGHVPAFKFPVALQVTPSKRFVIAAIKTTNLVAVYRIDQASGVLKEIPGSPFKVVDANSDQHVSSPYSVSIHPSGRFVYIAARWGGVVGFVMDKQSGVLTLMKGSPFIAGERTRSVKVHPSGRFLYASNAYSNNVSAFRINDKTGALNIVEGSPFPTGEKGLLNPDELAIVDAPPEAGGIPYRVDIHPSGQFVYVTNRYGFSLSVYRVDDKSGVLTPLEDSPVSTGGQPYGVTVHPSGKFVYVTSQSTNTIWGYRINEENGKLTSLPHSPFDAYSARPLSITFNSAGTFAYSVNVASNSITQFSVDTNTGSLDFIDLVRTRFQPFYMVLQESEPVDVAPHFTYITRSEQGKFRLHRTGADDVKTKKNKTQNKKSTDQLPLSAVVEPRGRFVYMAHDAGDKSDKSGIAAYRVDPVSGDLSPLPNHILSLGFVPTHMAMNVSAPLLYAVNSSINRLGVYTMDPENGALGPVRLPFPSTGTGPVAIALDPVGRFSFVANSGSGSVSVFTHVRMHEPAMNPINRTGSAFSVGDNPVALAVDPSGKYLVVANKDSNNLSVFTINYHKGNLEAVKGSPYASGKAPVSVTMHQNGQLVYVLNAGSGTISSYRIDKLTGQLTAMKNIVKAGKQPESISMDPEGRFAYVRNKGLNVFRKYSVDVVSGLLTYTGEVDPVSKAILVN